MDIKIVGVSIILIAAIVLLVTERLPVDLTAIGIVTVLMVTGILTPTEALVGFSNPAPITVAVLFVVSRGLVRSGALDFITATVVRFSKGSPKRLLFLILFLVGGFSSFLNNTPVVVLFISIVMAVCCQYSLSPSKFLLPVSFVSILAGTSTLIGTSTNIIVSDLAVQNGMAPIGMFELSALGIPMAMAGAVFLYFLSPKLLGSHKEPVCEVRNSDKNRYISDLVIPEGSPFVGRDPAKSFSEKFPDIELFQVVRDLELLEPDRGDVKLEVGDEILAWKFDGPTPDSNTSLLYRGRLYVVDCDNRVISCLDAKTGEQKWQQKLNARGAIRASPTGADGKIYLIKSDDTLQSMEEQSYADEDLHLRLLENRPDLLPWIVCPATCLIQVSPETSKRRI